MGIGLVMEGGAMRGMFTAGVIDVMLENGIAFDGAVGVSALMLVAGMCSPSICSKQQLGY